LRRQLRLPAAAENALRQHRARQQAQQKLMGEHWQDLGLVFPTGSGTLLDPAHLRRSLRTVTEQAGLGRWHPTSCGTPRPACCPQLACRSRRSPTCSGTPAPG